MEEKSVLLDDLRLLINIHHILREQLEFVITSRLSTLDQFSFGFC